jgi:hypothetical protein
VIGFPSAPYHRPRLVAPLLPAVRVLRRLTSRVSAQHRLPSIGRRNSRAEHLGWFHPMQRLSRTSSAASHRWAALASARWSLVTMDVTITPQMAPVSTPAMMGKERGAPAPPARYSPTPKMPPSAPPAAAARNRRADSFLPCARPRRTYCPRPAPNTAAGRLAYKNPVSIPQSTNMAPGVSARWPTG